MTLRDKIAGWLDDENRYRGCECLTRVAGDIRAGDHDNVLGKSDPSIEDVREEAKRVFGDIARVDSDDRVYVVLPLAIPVVAPTIASAYAALRALPSKEGE